MPEAFIYDHVRTPRGRGKADGALHEVTALALATVPLKALKDRNNLPEDCVDDVVLGVVDPVGEAGSDIARFAALKAGLGDAVDRLDRERRLPKVSPLLPEALGQANLPRIATTILEAIPDGLVDNVLPTRPLLRRTIDELDVNRLLHELNDPRQLNPAIRSAILQAALRQILARLHP